MSIRSLAKWIASFLVLGILAFTCVLAWHMTVKPVGGVFEKVVPSSADLVTVKGPVVAEITTDEAEVPEIDPGQPLYAKATEHLAMGHMREAREMLHDLVSRFPRSSTSNEARKILGEMNLDDCLSNRTAMGKSTYRVKPGDSYLAIASREGTSLENMMHINAMLEMRGLRPGDELILMPLDFHLVIDTNRKVLSISREDAFLCEFPILSLPPSAAKLSGKNEIASKSAEADGKRILPGTSGYVDAAKIIMLKSPAIRLQGEVENVEPPPGAIVLNRPDMETLNLLVRPGNQVEFR